MQMQMMAQYVLWRTLVTSNEAQVYGVALLVDFSGFSLGQMRKVQLADVKREVGMVQGTFTIHCTVLTIHCTHCRYGARYLPPPPRRSVRAQRTALVLADCRYVAASTTVY
jgi:hypothetical protein